MPTTLENIEIQLTKLALQPGYTLQVQFSRYLSGEELDNFCASLRPIVPANVRVIVLGPDAQLTHQPASQG